MPAPACAGRGPVRSGATGDPSRPGCWCRVGGGALRPGRRQSREHQACCRVFVPFPLLMTSAHISLPSRRGPPLAVAVGCRRKSRPTLAKSGARRCCQEAQSRPFPCPVSHLEGSSRVLGLTASPNCPRLRPQAYMAQCSTQCGQSHVTWCAVHNAPCSMHCPALSSQQAAWSSQEMGGPQAFSPIPQRPQGRTG